MSEPAQRRRQEQEAASSEVAEVAPGVLRLQLPIQFTGLGHVNCYALVDEAGVALVDAGMPGRATWKAIEERLEAAGIELEAVHSVIVTHSHPDHFGSAELLAKRAGADLIVERSFQTWLDRPQPSDSPYVEMARTGRTPWGGIPFEWSRRQRLGHRLARHGLAPYARPPRPTRRLHHGEQLQLAGRSWRALHTPGHTGDHLCLYDEEAGVLLSGDHVLPTITPHIGGITPLADPLGTFAASLAGLLQLGVTTVLPAHGHPFSDLAGRVRQILAHHDRRLASLREAAGGGEESVVELARRLFPARLRGMMAESETYAHLEFLRLRGEAERFERGGELCYRVDSGGGSSATSAALDCGRHS